MTDDMHCSREEVPIDVRVEYELRYWSRALGVSPEDLKRAVASVGPMVKHVRRHLLQRAGVRSGDTGLVKDTKVLSQPERE